jgi:hypothetical protein
LSWPRQEAIIHHLSMWWMQTQKDLLCFGAQKKWRIKNNIKKSWWEISHYSLKYFIFLVLSSSQVLALIHWICWLWWD